MKNGNFSNRTRKIIIETKNYVMIFVLLIIVIITASLSDTFFTGKNLINIFRQASVIGIVALGMHFVVIGGTFDNSVGSIVSLTGLLALGLQSEIGLWPAISVALFIGVSIGAVNGIIISLIKGNAGDSFMVTFGMQVLIQSLALIYSGGYIIPGSNLDEYNFFGKGVVWGIPVPALILIILAISSFIFLTKTKEGRQIYYMGANYEVARLSGIPVKKYRILVYMISGLFAAIAAVILTGRVGGAQPKAGLNYEFEALTALVIGGISLKGGLGNTLHAIIGILIMTVLGNALNLIGITPENQFIVKGTMLILAVIFEIYKNKKREGK